MPNLKTETYGSGDMSWLGSAHGIAECRTVTLNPADFTKATHYPDGVFKSGLPIGEDASGKPVAYVDGGSLAGFLFTDQPTNGQTPIPVPLLDHGRVKVDKVAAVQAGFAAPTPANDKTTVVYI